MAAAPHSGFVTPLPPGLNGSCITRDPRFGRGPGVYPVKVFGTFQLQTGQTLTGNAINLCYIPHGSILSDFKIVLAGLTAGQLQDSLATPTVYCTNLAAGAGETPAVLVATPSLMSATDAQNFGTNYAGSPRAAGLSGPAVVQWMPGITLQITGGAGLTAGSTTPVIYMVEWSPTYDAYH